LLSTVTVVELRIGGAKRCGTAFNAAGVLFQGMRAVGIDAVENDCVSSDRPPETRRKAAANALTAISSWLRMVSSKDTGMIIEELHLAEKIASTESEAGVYVRYEIYTVIGRPDERRLAAGRGLATSAAWQQKDLIIFQNADIST
jgi:hypothetical protein